ncbi:putative quinol monooxygenase [Methylocaldum gracile subsp. desertum]|uniref:putative quinol monooxygenase n=1 Tax=Methylocaldum sp. GT1BW TaxID=3438964 RepID=UPI003DA09FB5
MASKPVTVIVRIVAKPGMEAQVKRELMNLLAPTRSEKGCMNYDMHQAADDDSRFLFHENWVCEEDLRRHLEAPHIRHWITLAETLLAKPMELTLWHKVDY